MAGQEAMKARYGLSAPCGILSHIAARLDPYRMAHRLLARHLSRGGQVFDRTEIDSIVSSARGVELCTAMGARIRCRHVILAAGYESQQWLRRRVAQNRSSYAFVTDPVDRSILGFLSNTLTWESARPYLYLRTTRDGRLLVGGEDDPIDIPARRDRRVEAKALKLASKVQRLYPGLPVAPAFSWAGTFAETSDGLPYFGPHAQYGPRVHFAMAYGGNGITYSMIGAKLLADGIERRRHPLAGLFSFARLH
jgi:glycine/D-amino acid oxidase-like deaminating enzyme